MRVHRIAKTLLALVVLIMNGCYSVEYCDPVVCQYPPGERPDQASIKHPADLVLERFVADPSASSSSAPSAFVYQGTVWKDLKMAEGGKVGFRTERDQLIAFAGPTTMPLEPGHYYWISMGESKPEGAFKKPKDQDVIQLVLNATVVWPTIVAFWAALGIIAVAAHAPPPS